VVSVEKARSRSAKAQEIINSQSVSSGSTKVLAAPHAAKANISSIWSTLWCFTNALAAPHAAKAKISSIWSTLWCFRTQESHTDAEIIEGNIEAKQITIKKAAKSSKLRLKGRIFLHDITSVHTYNGNG
jgi:hypothetical protein